MTDEETRLHAYIPEDQDRRLEQGEKSKKEQVVEALELYFGEGNSNREAVKRQIARYKEHRARGQQLVQNGQEMVSEANERIAALEKKLESMEESVQAYDDAQDEILHKMQSERTSVFVDHAQIQEIAQNHDLTPQEVLADLKERSDLPPDYFTPGPVDDGNGEGLSFGGGNE